MRELLVEGRKGAALTQQKLAERLGRPQSFVAKYEVGERFLDVVEFIAIAAALNIDLPTAIARLQTASDGGLGRR